MPGWTFLTSHTRVFICLANTPGITLREVAAEAGITERGIHRVVSELEEAGYLTRHRLGHRNFYELHAELPLRDPMLGAGAAPITCKGSQTVQKAPGGGWECVNNGGGTPGGVIETKNPND